MREWGMGWDGMGWDLLVAEQWRGICERCNAREEKDEIDQKQGAKEARGESIGQAEKRRFVSVVRVSP
jgi:hypothetical protein